MDQLENKVREKITRDWRHRCSTKDILRTYRTFKNEDMCTASHLNSNLPKYERSLISQLRLGILSLRIETGRYTNLVVENRICQLCDMNEVENEAHFLFDCNLYDVIRANFEADLGSPLQNMSVTEKFDFVFEHPYSLGRFIRKAMNMRKDKLYR